MPKWLKWTTRIATTAILVTLSLFGGRWLWTYYNVDPWTRDGRVRADIVQVSPDVSALVIEVRVKNNQGVQKGDVLFVLDRPRFELTLRLARGAEEEAPPMWALNFLQNLARYVFKSGNVFAPGHHMNLNGPIALGRETAIQAIAFAADPELGARETPHGRVEFVRVVGLTIDELRAGVAWDTLKLLEAAGSQSGATSEKLEIKKATIRVE